MKTKIWRSLACFHENPSSEEHLTSNARDARARTRRLDANTDAIERARASSSSFAR